MTPADLYTLIQSDTQAAAMAAVGNDSGCAVRCVVIASKVATLTQMTYLGLADQVGPDVTRRLIVSVRTVAAQDPLVDEMQNVLRLHANGVDVSNPATQAMLDAFVGLNIPSGLTADDAVAIKALCMVQQSITADDVSTAMEGHR